MHRQQSIEQLIARDDNPEFATAQGRVMDEARITFIAIAGGRLPKTVLGGLILRNMFETSATEDARSLGEISAVVHLDPVSLNHRGDKPMDVLMDLIEVGWVEQIEPMEGTVEAHLADKPTVIRHFRLLPTALQTIEQ